MQRNTLVVILALFAPACDSPDDETRLEALDDEIHSSDRGEAAVQLDLELDLSAQSDPATAGCHYKVLWSPAGVYEKPGWKVLKTKNAGDIVGDWCDWTWYDGVNEWLAVTTSSAEDGIGWMRRSAVTKMQGP